MRDFVGEGFTPPVKSAATETPRDGYRVLAVTASLNGIRPILIYPLGGILMIGAVMCGINPVMGIINTAMTDWLNAMGGTSKVLLGAIVAGMMSIDMGGPFAHKDYKCRKLVRYPRSRSSPTSCKIQSISSSSCPLSCGSAPRSWNAFDAPMAANTVGMDSPSTSVRIS